MRRSNEDPQALQGMDDFSAGLKGYIGPNGPTAKLKPTYFGGSSSGKKRIGLIVSMGFSGQTFNVAGFGPLSGGSISFGGNS